MTLVEFLHPLKNAGVRTLCLAAMYYSQRYQSIESMTVEGLRANLKRARVPRADKLNLADTLSKAAPYVDTIGKEVIFPRFDGHFSMIRNQGVRDEWKETTDVRGGVQAADC